MGIDTAGAGVLPGRPWGPGGLGSCASLPAGRSSTRDHKSCAQCRRDRQIVYRTARTADPPARGHREPSQRPGRRSAGQCPASCHQPSWDAVGCWGIAGCLGYYRGAGVLWGAGVLQGCWDIVGCWGTAGVLGCCRVLGRSGGRQLGSAWGGSGCWSRRGRGGWSCSSELGAGWGPGALSGGSGKF